MIPNRAYRKIFIVESKQWWADSKGSFIISEDIVLTYDFSLHLEIKKSGGLVFYIDHCLDKMTMQANNFVFYKFFKDWHFDQVGNDLFTYRGIPFGFSLRLEIWNDLSFYIRTRICLEQLRQLSYKEVVLASETPVLDQVLAELEIPYSKVGVKSEEVQFYYFPIQKWLDEKVRYKGLGGLKYILRDAAGLLQGGLMRIIDCTLQNARKKPAIFIQEYHPTKAIVKNLLNNPSMRVILATFSRRPGLFRYIPVYGSKVKFSSIAEDYIKIFKENKSARFILSSGTDVSDSMYKIIEERISDRLAEYIYNLNCVIDYIDQDPMKLIVLVTNIGKIATLVDCVGKVRKIPTYLIINGYMSGDFLDDSKYATYINGYSQSIKEHYYRGIKNVYALGDPRMDSYAHCVPRAINRTAPTITIGTSAHSIIDLNSYLAVEFDFLYDVLLGIQRIKDQGTDVKVVLKVRANGYINQYKAFVEEFFSGMVETIVDNVTIKSVLENTDLYISLYSQTHFEASCMGIPCIYYKNDTEILDPPYEGETELVRVSTVDDLEIAIQDFLAGADRFDKFLTKEVMEKYIGPLDGKNLARNIDFIHKIINNEVDSNLLNDEIH